MTDILFNDGEEDYKVSKIRFIDDGKNGLRIVIYPERNSTKTYWLKEKE